MDNGKIPDIDDKIMNKINKFHEQSKACIEAYKDKNYLKINANNSREEVTDTVRQAFNAGAF